ncbi:Mss4-like protein [Glarea lozoyensis ATCC 20868]|uniref:Mss4-like protein n=1 Tax=Glarea lozoyensis (strain ATCC 20868 / MF5171) TaxID=1116229 RepID=S3DEQ0_GLAL2|nr:Mss4-like protein [Glarea lozoyensis ATCC 20868]EPE36225.1 Mss4-like protein [Glarea lozoyensis ATCC 20868]
MAQEGGCFCDKIRISYTGEPGTHVLCHCLDCRKISGSSYGNNIVVPENNFKLLQGKPKTISKTADGGNEITSHFCGDCGTTLMRTGPSFPGSVIIKVGVMDDPDWPNKNTPKGELYVGSRVKLHDAIPGAAQMRGMPS